MILRLLLQKGPEARFISHLDLARAMERALRRARVPVAYSEGFNPHPRLAFASALAVGATSEGEVLEVHLREPLPADKFHQVLNEQLPPGLHVALVRQAGGPGLAESLDWAAYRLQVEAAGSGPVDWQGLTDAFLSRPGVHVERQGKEGKTRDVDVRALVGRLVLLEGTGPVASMEALVRAGSRANLRPEELVRGLASLWDGGSLELVGVHRLGLYAGRPDALQPLWEL